MTNIGKDVEKSEYYTLLVGCKMVKPKRTVWWFFNKLNIVLLCDPAFPLLDIYSKELKTGVQTKLAHKCS